MNTALRNTAQPADLTFPWLKVTSTLAIAAAIVICAWLNPSANAPWFSVLPPVVAITFVIVTGRLVAALFVACMLGGLLADGGIGGIWRGGGYFTSTLSDRWNLQIMCFVPFIMATISLMVAAGGFRRIIEIVARICRGRRSTQFSTFLAGFALFFDDYANTMVIGSSMKPLADRHHISRAKLAFLVDATSAPIAGLAIVSTWIGYEVGLFREVSLSLELGRDGFSMFIDALSFRFYCIMMIIFVIINATTGKDFGPMLAAEQAASLGQNTTSNGAPLPTEITETPSSSPNSASPHSARPNSARPHAAMVIVPIGSLIFMILFGYLYDGGVFERSFHLADLWRLSYWQKVFTTAENSITTLMTAAATSLFFATLLARWLAKLSYQETLKAIAAGFKISIVPLAVLILAWSLKAACDDLNTGIYLASTIGAQVDPTLFPALVFILASVSAFSTGTSWGTMAILIPTMFPVAYHLSGHYDLICMMTLAAVLDGSIFGDHCSPISDTTIMSATASGCDVMSHVKTQLPYAMAVGSFALVFGYLATARGVPSYVGVLTATVFMGGLLLRFGRTSAPREAR